MENHDKTGSKIQELILSEKQNGITFKTYAYVCVSFIEIKYLRQYERGIKGKSVLMISVQNT